MVVIKARRLDRNFFIQDALTVAKSLIGKLMIRLIDDCEIVCRIVETEAYIGPEDKGCHAYGGRKTKRTEVMFEEGGITYVYLIYGMYYCINVVAGGKGKPEAALIRALEPLKGIDILKKNRALDGDKLINLTNGPGKLCQALNIDKRLNGHDLLTSQELYLLDDNWRGTIKSSSRINISYAEEYIDKPWRFFMADNLFVSKG